MSPILTAEDVVKRIAAECAFVDERGAVGIRLTPAAAIVRQYREQFRGPQAQAAAKVAETAEAAMIRRQILLILLFQSEACVADSLHRVARPV